MKRIDSFRGDYCFLSNFHPCKIQYEGIEYTSVEHAYQASKSMSWKIRKEIANLLKPGDAKRMGKNLLIRKDWDTVKLSIMKELVKKKFSIPELQKKLLATGDAELVEGNWWGDDFWGVCNGRGENYLGKILMEVRNFYADSIEERRCDELKI
jgi:N-glycosidase YbiA